MSPCIRPKFALVVGGDHDDGAGYLLKGELSIEEDPDRVWLRRTSDHYHDDPDVAERLWAEFAPKDMIVLRLRVIQVSPPRDDSRRILSRQGQPHRK